MQAAFVLARNNTVLADSSYASQRTAGWSIFERKWQPIVVEPARCKHGAGLAQTITTDAPIVRMKMLSGRTRPVSAQKFSPQLLHLLLVKG